MNALIALVVQLLHVALLLATAPLAAGLAASLAARLAGRAAPPLLQPWRALWRLLRKQPVFADTASGLFAGAPALAFAATLLAAALVPSFALGMAGARFADLIVIAGLLLLARVVLALAALDSGTALGGLGASRAMALVAGTEPALLLAVVPLALLVGTTNLDVMESVLREGAVGARLPLLLAVLALGVVGLARLPSAAAADVPFGEVATAEAALEQEYAGRQLALLHWAAALRRLLWLGLLAGLALPFGLADATGSPLDWLVAVVAWAAKLAVLSVALAAWQGARAARPGRLPAVLGLAVLLALLAAALLVLGQGAA